MYDRQAIEGFFRDFSGKGILVIGDVMIDAYLWGGVDRISPEAPVPIVSLHRRENRLGGAANVALNLRNLGARPILCSVTGEDDKGRLFLDLLQQQGLEAGGMLTDAERITTVKYRIIGNNTQMLRVDEESRQALTDAMTGKLLERIKALIGHHPVHAIVFEDYDKGVIGPALIREVVALARARDIPVAVDPKKNNFLLYRDVSLFKPNQKELREGLKLDGDLSDPREVGRAAGMLHEQLEADVILATLSDKGIFYSRRDGQGQEEGIVGGRARDIADVSGAGDTVISVAALSMACRLPVRLMAELCNLAGGIVCEQVGVVPVDRNRLQEEAIRYLSGS